MKNAVTTPLVKFLKWLPWWQIARLSSLAVLACLITWPFFEIRAFDSSVIFFNGKKAVLAWDPPESGTVDHYLVEVTTTRVLDGPSNTITTVAQYATKENQYEIPTSDGNIYSFRVKAVGPNGAESPFSDETLTVICDCKNPEVDVLPINGGQKVRSRTLHLTGSFFDTNISSIEINGKSVKIDLSSGKWSADIPLAEGRNQIRLVAKDFAGNTYRRTFDVWQEPVVVTSEPEGADLYIMGSPAYPGIYITRTPIKIYQVIDPALKVPVCLKKENHAVANSMLSFPEGQDRIVLPVANQVMPAGYEIHRIAETDLEGMDDMVYPFPVDYDQDGKPEILVNTTGGTVFLVEQVADLASGTWKASPLQIQTEQSFHGNPFLIDFNNDIRYELALFNPSDDSLHILEDRAGTWGDGRDIKLAVPEGEGHAKDFGFLDWNRDHKKDLFLDDPDTGKIFVLLNTGQDNAPLFGQDVKKFSLTGRKAGAPANVFDWNDDGRPDFVGETDSGSLAVWIREDKGPSFLAPEFSRIILPIKAVDLGADILYPSIVDWNRDGIPDLVVGTDTGELFLLIGT